MSHGMYTRSFLLPLRSNVGLSKQFLISSNHASKHCRTIATVDLDRRKGDRERVVILGSGWAGYGLSRQLSAKKFQTVVISPRSYFVFTPLLNSTAVGTLEFRTALEPIRNRRYPNIEFVQGWADDVDFSKKIVGVEESVLDGGQSVALTEDRYAESTNGQEQQQKRVKTKQSRLFDIAYDKLVIAVGCYSQTFGTKGVKENAYFLKDVGDARRIRKRVLELFEVSALPTTQDQLKKQLLNFAVIGGGPTGMEFAAELSDLLNEDMRVLYPGLGKYVQITVYDVAPNVLSMFDKSLADYAMATFRRENIRIKTEHHVEELRRGLPNMDSKSMEVIANAEGCFTLKTTEDGEVGIGICVWAAGNMMNPFVEKALKKVQVYPEASAITHAEMKDVNAGSHQELDWLISKNPKTNAIVVDDHLRVQLQLSPSTEQGKADDKPPLATASMTDVFALGDNAMLGNAGLPATAQTANQQALWLGKRLNKDDVDSQNFTFKNMGVMTYLGNSRGLVQTGGNSGIQGRTAWLIWRGAYLTLSVSWRNKILILLYWFLNWAFGRDISRF